MGGKAGFAESDDHERGEHVACAREEAGEARDVDFKEARRVVGAGGGADYGECGCGGRQPDGGDDYVGNLVDFVERGNCVGERGEGLDRYAGESSE